jgi:hypothetical protein
MRIFLNIRNWGYTESVQLLHTKLGLIGQETGIRGKRCTPTSAHILPKGILYDITSLVHFHVHLPFMHMFCGTIKIHILFLKLNLQTPCHKYTRGDPLWSKFNPFTSTGFFVGLLLLLPVTRNSLQERVEILKNDEKYIYNVTAIKGMGLHMHGRCKQSPPVSFNETQVLNWATGTRCSVTFGPGRGGIVSYCHAFKWL